MSICMNPVCRVKGRCDYCDARCPYYAENYIECEALLQAIEGLPSDISDGLKNLVHDITIRQIEEELKNETK